jgi:DNA-binding NtrC family response regulator
MTKGRILVVDDRENWRTQFQLMLQEEGYEVETAASYTAAILALQQRLFHLAVVDVRLIDADRTNKDGLELIVAMEKNRWPTAVILITGYGMVEYKNDQSLKNPRVKAFLHKRELNANQFRKLVAKSIAGIATADES